MIKQKDLLKPTDLNYYNDRILLSPKVLKSLQPLNKSKTFNKNKSKIFNKNQKLNQMNTSGITVKRENSGRQITVSAPRLSTTPVPKPQNSGSGNYNNRSPGPPPRPSPRDRRSPAPIPTNYSRNSDRDERDSRDERGRGDRDDDLDSDSESERGSESNYRPESVHLSEDDLEDDPDLALLMNANKKKPQDLVDDTLNFYDKDESFSDKEVEEIKKNSLPVPDAPSPVSTIKSDDSDDDKYKDYDRDYDKHHDKDRDYREDHHKGHDSDDDYDRHYDKKKDDYDDYGAQYEPREPQTYEDRQSRKQDLLFKLDRLKRRGFNIPNFTMDSHLDDIELYYNKIDRQIQLDRSIAFSRKALMFCVTGIEYLNTTWDPFNIDLNGWPEEVYNDMGTYDDIFEELHEKYKNKVKMAPELKLLMALGGSAFQFHLRKTMFKSFNEGLPGGNPPGMRGGPSPDILRNIHQAQQQYQNPHPQSQQPMPPMGNYGGISTQQMPSSQPQSQPPMGTGMDDLMKQMMQSDNSTLFSDSDLDVDSSGSEKGYKSVSIKNKKRKRRKRKKKKDNVIQL